MVSRAVKLQTRALDVELVGLGRVLGDLVLHFAWNRLDRCVGALLSGLGAGVGVGELRFELVDLALVLGLAGGFGVA